MINILSEGVEDYDVDGKRVLIDSLGNVAILNVMADIVLKQIESGKAIEDVIQLISEDYNQPIEVVKNDVERFLYSLSQKRILKDHICDSE